MKIEYKITEYFDKEGMFDASESTGLNIKMEDNAIVINGTSRDLVELADFIVNIAKEKERAHLHIDDLTLIQKDSDIKEIIIEKTK